jgi:hypothetical protein
MANILSKSGITTGNTVRAWHVTQSIDAFTGEEEYDLTLSGSLTLTGSLIFDTSLEEGDHVPGRLQWDTTDQTLKLDLNVSGSSLQIGQEFHVYARNESGVTINNGEAVRIVGTTGNKVTIEKAIAKIHTLNIPDENEIIGLATQTIDNNSFGYITLFGTVRNLNTSLLTEGQICYVSHTTSGSLTNTKPPAPYDTIKVGIVERSNTNNGQILVKPVDPIHMNDITGITGSNIPTGVSYWTYNSSSGITSLTNELSGSFSGSFVGNGSGLTGVSGSNFANTNLTFTGNRSHNTNGNTLEVTTDGGGYSESYYYQDPTILNLGVGQYQMILTSESISFQTSSIGGDYIFNITRPITSQNPEVVFNESGKNVDFRVESENLTHIIFVDGGSDMIGINKNSPSSTLDINGNTTITGSLNITGSTIIKGNTQLYGREVRDARGISSQLQEKDYFIITDGNAVFPSSIIDGNEKIIRNVSTTVNSNLDSGASGSFWLLDSLSSGSKNDIYVLPSQSSIHFIGYNEDDGIVWYQVK